MTDLAALVAYAGSCWIPDPSHESKAAPVRHQGLQDFICWEVPGFVSLLLKMTSHRLLMQISHRLTVVLPITEAILQVTHTVHILCTKVNKLRSLGLLPNGRQKLQ